MDPCNHSSSARVSRWAVATLLIAIAAVILVLGCWASMLPAPGQRVAPERAADHPSLTDPSPALVDDCTSLVLDNGGQAIFATNYDQSRDDDGLVFIHPRGVVKTGLNPSTTGVHARWTARYASIVFSLLGAQHAWAGMNERGLVFSTMRLDATENQPPDHRPPLDWMWTQYLLDTCETVQEVIASDHLVRTYTVDHHLFADRYGGVAVIEFLDGEMVAHSGSQLCVAALTNSSYSYSCSMWQHLRQTGLYSQHGNSIERFCRAADQVLRFETTSTAEAVAHGFRILQMAYPPAIQRYTRWSIVFGTVNLRAYFKTQRNPNVRWVDLAAFDLGCADPIMMLDINQDLEGDVSDSFTPLDVEQNRAFMQAYYDRWSIPYDAAQLRAVQQQVESFACPQHRHVRGRRSVQGTPR